MDTDRTLLPDHLLPIGYRLEEYEILGRLGEGGFGAVYLARDRVLEQKRAIKEFLPGQLALRGDGHSIQPRSGQKNAENYRAGLASFIREAQLLAGVDHPCIVRVYRCIEANNTAYIVMQYCEGETLDAWARRQGGAAPNPQWVQFLLWQLLEGVQTVHDRGILHRDIKPENIFLVDGFRPVLIDFGAARRVVSELSHTLTNIVTPGFSPLEQYGEAADANMRQGPWTDIYALAATMYRLIKGGKPMEPHLRVMNDQTVPLVKIGAQRYPIAFLQSIDKALAVRPADRFQSVAEWRNALGTLPFPGIQQPVEPEEPKLPRHAPTSRLLRGGGILLLAAVAALGVYYWKGREIQPSANVAQAEMARVQAELDGPKRQMTKASDNPSPAPAAKPPQKDTTATPPQAAAPVADKPGQVFRDCENCPELVAIPAGGFLMGSSAGEDGRQADEGPAHRVQVALFALGKYEITREEWERFAKATGRPSGVCDTWQGGGWRKDAGKNWSKPGFAQTPKDPAVCIGWDDAQAYVGWLSQQTGQPYRLPSEAEWEYAARAGSEGAHDWDKEGAVSCTYANIQEQWGKPRTPACSDKYANTAPVGSYKPNAFGLYDLLGNVWEWTADCWHPGYDGAPTDGGPWTDGGDCNLRVLRGGSWADAATATRYANRDKETPATGANIHGFRVARSLAVSH